MHKPVSTTESMGTDEKMKALVTAQISLIDMHNWPLYMSALIHVIYAIKCICIFF